MYFYLFANCIALSLLKIIKIGCQMSAEATKARRVSILKGKATKAKKEWQYVKNVTMPERAKYIRLNGFMLNQDDTAEVMGTGKGTQAKIESSEYSLNDTLESLFIKCYITGVSLDFAMGLSHNPEGDLNAQIYANSTRLAIDTLTEIGRQAAESIYMANMNINGMPVIAKMDRLLPAAVDMTETVEWLLQKHPKIFEELPGGNKLLRGAKSARQAINDINKWDSDEKNKRLFGAEMTRYRENIQYSLFGTQTTD